MKSAGFVAKALLRSAHKREFNSRAAGKACNAVAIPARNEAQRLGQCLQAIGQQSGISPPTTIVVLLNNTNDNSLDILEQTVNSTGSHTVAVNVDLPAKYANAGWARRLAMDAAAQLLADDGILLTTDADARADPEWILRNLESFAEGADAVAGFVTADWSELSLFPPEILQHGAREWEYQFLCAEVDARLDPIPHDPWPNHNQGCGASLAVRLPMYGRIGGLPPIPTGEDRALIDEVYAAPGRVRHAIWPHVTASARKVGRAKGGMAEALLHRGTEAYYCDDILEPARITVMRARLRAQARANFVLNSCGTILGFEAFWKSQEMQHSALPRHLLRSYQLDAEIRRLRHVLRLLRLRDAVDLKPDETLPPWMPAIDVSGSA